jgi:hypothetical protein
LVLVVIEKLVRGHHVHEADDAAVLVVLGSACTSQHRDGANSTIKAGRLLQTDGRTGDLEVAIPEWDIVQPFNDSVDDLVVCVLTERDTLCMTVSGKFA